jgi:hypothetical protein
MKFPAAHHIVARSWFSTLRIEPFGSLTAIPKIDASSGSIVSVQVILPDETRDAAIVWCRFLEHCFRIVAVAPSGRRKRTMAVIIATSVRKVATLVMDMRTIAHAIASGNDAEDDQRNLSFHAQSIGSGSMLDALRSTATRLLRGGRVASVSCASASAPWLSPGPCA